ncbi:MAG: hypothetical protein EPO40_06105 [Myxococcaceae bacterium]|nr:MAG: hypothetical protein EPO40_06105 [Myxococcaceae bacterium]
MTTDLRIVYDDTHRRPTPHAPAAWQLTDEGLADHVGAITVRKHLMNSVRKHGEHQGEAFLRLAAQQLVEIARLEALRVVDEPIPFCPKAARRIVDGWARFGAELRAMRSGIAA